MAEDNLSTLELYNPFSSDESEEGDSDTLFRDFQYDTAENINAMKEKLVEIVNRIWPMCEAKIVAVDDPVNRLANRTRIGLITNEIYEGCLIKIVFTKLSYCMFLRDVRYIGTREKFVAPKRISGEMKIEQEVIVKLEFNLEFLPLNEATVEEEQVVRAVGIEPVPLLPHLYPDEPTYYSCGDDVKPLTTEELAREITYMEMAREAMMREHYNPPPCSSTDLEDFDPLFGDFYY